jgi:hypothetical protein
MPRAATKEDLIESANANFEKLWALIDTLSEREQALDFDYGDEKLDSAYHWKRDKNLRDVLVHLYEWHRLLLDWVSNNTRGIEKPFLLEPFNWRNYQEMNVVFFERHQNTPLEKAKELFQASHKDVIATIERFSNDELFAKGRFKWTGPSSLGQYCVSVTASHYDWAMKKLKTWLKALKPKG